MYGATMGERTGPTRSSELQNLKGDTIHVYERAVQRKCPFGGSLIHLKDGSGSDA